jgi:exosortase
MKVLQQARIEPGLPAPTPTVSPAGPVVPRSLASLLVMASLAVGLLWCFWPTLGTMAERWSNDPQYSHGFLVPVFALLVLWFRKNALRQAIWRPAWWGLPVLLAGVFLRLLAVRMALEPLDAISLLPTLAGLVLLVGGWDYLRWSWPALAFLGFMLPLPFQVEVALAQPLRRLATSISTYALQTLGYAAIAEGNIILIDQARLGVAEACSGLGMLMTFFALATAMALVIRAPLLDRLVLVASAAPIAVLANVARITATGVAYQTFDGETAHLIMHDFAGWLMMPFALVVLWLELRYLTWLFPPQRTEPSLPLAIPGARPSGH